MKSPVYLCVAMLLASQPAFTRQTTLYQYDNLGRLVASGRSDSTSSLYVYDQTDNRWATRCCLAIGGEQVKDDGFDPYFYLLTYADVRAANIDPYQHWLEYGASEGRWPNRYFDTNWCRSTYAIPANVNPLTDYHDSGWRAGWNPSVSFSTTAYHNAHPDTSGLDPLYHYLKWGYGEGRILPGA